MNHQRDGGVLLGGTTMANRMVKYIGDMDPAVIPLPTRDGIVELTCSRRDVV